MRIVKETAGGEPAQVTAQDLELIGALARRALGMGLDGLEARYTTYTPEWEALADSLAAEMGLLRSGGSDFHGARKANRLGTGYGGLAVPAGWAVELAGAAGAVEEMS